MAGEANYTGALAKARLAGRQPEAVQDNAGVASGAWGLRFLFAAFADLLSLVPVVGSVVGPAAIFIITISFWGSGKPLGTSKLISTGLSPVAEFLFSALPSVLAHTTICYLTRNKS